MATSVSSERAFSQSGLTITDRRTRLKGDIIEALQFLKCLIRQDLIYAPPAPSSTIEENYLDDDELEEMAGTVGSSEQNSGFDRDLWGIVLDETDNTLYEE